MHSLVFKLRNDVVVAVAVSGASAQYSSWLCVLFNRCSLPVVVLYYVIQWLIPILLNASRVRLVVRIFDYCVRVLHKFLLDLLWKGSSTKNALV